MLKSINNKIEEVEQLMLTQPQVDCPVRHIFGPGIYIREVTFPTGCYALGHHHNDDHLNILVKGKIQLFNDDGSTIVLEAPYTFTAPPGRKIAYVIDEVVWHNVYATNEQDINKLEAKYLTKSEQSEANNQLLLPNLADREDYKLLCSELEASPFKLNEAAIKEIVEDMSDHVDLPYGNYKFQLAQSSIEGNGIFAVGNIAKGELIGPARLNGCRTILGRRINHSLRANAIMVPFEGNVYLYAARDIVGKTGNNLGEEILIDYRFTLFSLHQEALCQEPQPQ